MKKNSFWHLMSVENKPEQFGGAPLVFSGQNGRTMLGRYYLVAGCPYSDEMWHVYFIQESGKTLLLASRNVLHNIRMNNDYNEEYREKISQSPPYTWAGVVYQTLENFSRSNCMKCSKDYNIKLEQIADAAEEFLSWPEIDFDENDPAYKKLRDALSARHTN